MANHLPSGPVAPEIGNLSKLEDPHLSDNLLSGCIPPEVGKTRSCASLRWLRLHGVHPAHGGVGDAVPAWGLNGCGAWLAPSCSSSCSPSSTPWATCSSSWTRMTSTSASSALASASRSTSCSRRRGGAVQAGGLFDGAQTPGALYSGSSIRLGHFAQASHSVPCYVAKRSPA